MQQTDEMEDHGDEHVLDRVKDDMTSRRISSHIPAPLRKKKNEDQYKKFLTPTGNPVAYLQQHMRSKSMSDLNDEEKEKEHHRAEINMRYEEMGKLKVLLKEEEDTWTSKLQGWKSRRRSVTEDARKRKEERDSLEKEAEIKSLRRKSKTYKQIVEDKIKRDKELAQLHDHDEYEFVTQTSPIIEKMKACDDSGGRNSFNTLTNPLDDMKLSKEKKMVPLKKSQNDDEFNPEPSTDQTVQYKYTTKVTAVINNPTSNEKSDEKQQSIKSVTTLQLAGNQKNDASATYIFPSVNVSKKVCAHNNESSRKVDETNITSKVLKEEPHSHVPKVLLRAKKTNDRKERPRSAHDLQTGSSRSLPSNYRDYSTPKPFTPGSSNFTQYRKTDFAKRRSMWESISRPENKTIPVNAPPIIHGRNASDELLSSKSLTEQVSVVVKPNHSQSRSVQYAKGIESKAFESINSLNKEQNKRSHPARVPLVSKALLQSTASSQDRTDPEGDASLTATLSASGLSMTSPHIRKTSPAVGKSDALFDDMKICINQRPRSEKGFGFTVRGGDDEKPVIVDTVSPGGAADICQLSVSDEILAINEVPLADCKTQDDIVQLIVSSVITGHLSLNIRRYGKAKKVSPLRLSGTKVVMTPGGFVQVRSDKPIQRTQVKSPLPSQINNELSLPAVHRDNNNNETISDDFLPPPPSQQELSAAFNPTSLTTDIRESPLSALVVAASQKRDLNSRYEATNESSDQANSSDDSTVPTLSEVRSKGDDLENEEEVHQKVVEAQKTLDFEQMYQHAKLEEQQLRLKLREEHVRLEEEEAQREQARRLLQEEAKLEDMRVEEELRRIQARKLKLQQERRKQNERLQNVDRIGDQILVPGPCGPQRNGIGRTVGASHWMIEEAERRRVAEMEGKPRIDALQYSHKSDSVCGAALPDHVIRHLTQNASSRPVVPRPYIRKQTPFM